MATPNYGYEKRQRELAKKRKKEEKLRAKADRKAGTGGPGEVDSAEDRQPGDEPAGTAGQPPQS